MLRAANAWLMQYNASLSLMVPNASDPGAQAAAEQMNSYLQDFQTSSGRATTELPTVAATGAANVWMSSADSINRLLYCGYRQVLASGFACTISNS